MLFLAATGPRVVETKTIHARELASRVAINKFCQWLTGVGTRSAESQAAAGFRRRSYRFAEDSDRWLALAEAYGRFGGPLDVRTRARARTRVSCLCLRRSESGAKIRKAKLE